MVDGRPGDRGAEGRIAIMFVTFVVALLSMVLITASYYGSTVNFPGGAGPAREGLQYALFMPFDLVGAAAAAAFIAPAARRLPLRWFGWAGGLCLVATIVAVTAMRASAASQDRCYSGEVRRGTSLEAAASWCHRTDLAEAALWLILAPVVLAAALGAAGLLAGRGDRRP